MKKKTKKTNKKKKKSKKKKKKKKNDASMIKVELSMIVSTNKHWGKAQSSSP